MLAIVFGALTAGSAWGQNYGSSLEEFEKFIAQMAEMDKKSQLKLVRENLTEFYDQNCQERKRPAKRDSAIAKWKFILPGAAARKKETLGFRAELGVRGQGLVYLDKNETWLYGILYFDWDNQANNWRMTGFKFDMAEPGDCL